MKKTLILSGLMLFILAMQAQSILFYEDFETLPLTQVSSSGTPGWAPGTNLASSGLRSDSSSCQSPGDSSVLVTVPNINTTAYGYVMLEFDHICKIEFYDGGYIEVSVDNGQTWTGLTGTNYLGSGQFVNLGGKFNSTSYLDWLPGNPSPPSNTWWKHEYFDISAIAANTASVKIRFILKDENNTSVFDNYAWFLDNIKVTGALSELTPPIITLLPPVMQGVIFSLGPFQIGAEITDTSGIDTAWVVYRVNNSSWDSVAMISGIVNIYNGVIPVVNDDDTVDYYIIALDGSLSHNAGRYPSAGHITFYASSGFYPPYHNDFEVYDSLWIPVTTSPQTNWEYGYPNYGILTGAHSGTNAWTTNKDSLHGNSSQVTLTSPYFNFTQAEDLRLSFWQNRRTEATWDGMHMEYTTDGLNWYILGGLNDPLGENWYTDTIYATAGMPAWEGSSGGWIKSSYRLSFLNYTPMVRFRFVFNSDPFVTFEGVSVDDFSIMPRPAADVNVLKIVAPVSSCQPGFQPVSALVRNDGADTLISIPMRYHVAGATQPVAELMTDSLFPDSTKLFVFNTLLNMQLSGKDSLFQINVYSALPADTFNHNDTVFATAIAGAIPNDPVPVHQTIPYATSTTLTALSSDTLFWFSLNAGGNVLHVGTAYTTPVLFDSITYWVEARAGIGKLRFTELTFESTGLGCNNPYPSYIPPSTQWDGVEITNTGASPVDLTGYIFHMQGYNTINYPLPAGVVLMPGELTVISVYAYPSIPSDTLNRFYVAGNLAIYATSQLGFWIEAPDGSVEDAFAVNGYDFGPASPVTAAHWSGSLPSGTGRAGVIRVVDDTNLASDWQLSNLPAPVQTIGTHNPQLPPVTSLGCPGNRIPVHVFMASYPLLDAGVTTILTPTTAPNLTTAEAVKIVVRNFGTQPVTSYTVSCSLDGSTPSTETFSDTLAPGDTVHITLSATLDLSSWQIYNLKVWTTLNGDTVPINDTAFATVTHLLPPYCISAAQYTSLADISTVVAGAMTNISPTGIKTYTDYTHLPPAQLIKGLNYPFSVTVQSQSTYNYTFGVKIFMDINGDGQFDPLTETIFSGLTSSTQNIVAGSYTIPLSARSGLTMMRAVAMYTSALTNVTPCGTYSYGETEDYLVMILPQLSHDAGVSGIGPFTPPLIIGEQVTISAWVKNFGADTLNNPPAGWMIDGMPPTIIPTGLSLPPGDSSLFTFPSSMTVPQGAFILKLFSDLQNDGYRNNDTTQITLLGEKDYIIFYFDDFEDAGFNGWTPELTVLWQKGKPAANVINYAHSPTNVWTTRLNGQYMNNLNKGLITPEFDFKNLKGLSLRFWHWYEIEEGIDGGNVKYSLNGGTTYLTLGYIGDTNGVNWYNSYASGKFSFSGHTGKWGYSSYDISSFDNHQTPISFKFDFFSNSTIMFNGWALDDFMITVEKASVDAGITEILQPNQFVTSGTTFYPQVSIKNFGTSPLSNIPLAFTINGGLEIHDTFAVLLQPGQSVVHTFVSPGMSPGYMELKAYTKLPGDQYSFNNATTVKLGQTGISEQGIISGLQLLPNPAYGRININITIAEAGKVGFTLYDLTGRVVLHQETYTGVGEHSEEMLLQGVDSGIYTLSVITASGRNSARVFVYR